MKLRISILANAVLFSGSLVLVAMTKAELTEVLAARIQIEAILPEGVDVLIPDVPALGYESVESSQQGGAAITQDRGRRIVSEIKLRFPVDAVPSALFEWHRETREGGEFRPRPGVLTLIDDEGAESGKFNLTNCWVRAWNHARITRVGFRGSVVEEVCLICDDIDIAFPGVVR